MRWLGNLACATTATDPMEMTVSQSGVAYVPQDANIYRADLGPLARTRTPYMDGQLGFSVGSIAISPSDDRLYMLGTIGDMGAPTVAVSDLVDFQVHLIGDIEPVFWPSTTLLSTRRWTRSAASSPSRSTGATSRRSTRPPAPPRRRPDR